MLIPESYGGRNFPSSAELRQPVTTPGFAVGNLLWMVKGRRSGYVRTPQQRRRTFIAEWREFRGMTQEKLAERMDTTKATISRIENRQIGYGQDFLETCADVLGVHASVLLARGPDDSDRMAIQAAPGRGARARRA